MSDEYYSFFEDFSSLLTSKNSYTRTRGFALCCAQSQWDLEEKIQDAFPIMLTLLYDKKPIVVRQCLAALHEVILYKPELSETISEAVKKINLSNYNSTMAPLIKKDANKLLEIL